MIIDALRHHREDPLVLGQETSEGVLARTGHPQPVAPPTTPQGPTHPKAILAVTVARQPPCPQPTCRSTPGSIRTTLLVFGVFVGAAPWQGQRSPRRRAVGRFRSVGRSRSALWRVVEGRRLPRAVLAAFQTTR